MTSATWSIELEAASGWGPNFCKSMRRFPRRSKSSVESCCGGGAAADAPKRASRAGRSAPGTSSGQSNCLAPGGSGARCPSTADAWLIGLQTPALAWSQADCEAMGATRVRRSRSRCCGLSGFTSRSIPYKLAEKVDGLRAIEAGRPTTREVILIQDYPGLDNSKAEPALHAPLAAVSRRSTSPESSLNC
jgi:hypothetical protein